MASSSTPNHDFAPAWLRLPTNAQRPSSASTNAGDSLTRRGGDHDGSNSANTTTTPNNLTNNTTASKTKSLSQEQRRDRGRAAFPFRHHSIDADDHNHQRSLGGGNNYSGGSGTNSHNGDYRLHASQRQHSGSQPSLGGVSGSNSRRPLSRQDFRDGSKGFGGNSNSNNANNFEHHNGGGDHYRDGHGNWGRQRSFDRAGRSGSGSCDLSGVGGSGSSSSRSSGGGGGGGGGNAGGSGSKWRDEPVVVDHIDKFDKDFPSLKSGSTGDSVLASSSSSTSPVGSAAGGVGGVAAATGAGTSVSSVWLLDKGKSGKIQLGGAGGLLGKRLHLFKKQTPAARSDVAATSTVTTPTSRLSTGSCSTTISPGGNTTTVTNNGSTSVYRTLGSTKGPMLRRPSNDSVKLNGLPSKQTVPPSSPPVVPAATAIPAPQSSLPFTTTTTCSVTTTSPSSTVVDVLNARCLVTHPKLLSANKSDFLRELRDEAAEREETAAAVGQSGGDSPAVSSTGATSEQQCNGHRDEKDEADVSPVDVISPSIVTASVDVNDDAAVLVNGIADQEPLVHVQLPTVNGINIRGTPEGSHGNEILSRSLEAEQRLLREMGWKEEGSEDEDVYAPLTEDEMKEFECLSKQIPKRNGFQRNVQFTWSPKRVLTIPSALHLESGGSSTSTSSDSDSD